MDVVAVGLTRTISRPIVRHLIDMGVHIAGGFPLWLAGGASFYSDIDVYPPDWRTYYEAHQYLRKVTQISGHTPETTCFMDGREIYQIVKPMPHQSDPLGLMTTTDLSPSACVLHREGRKYSVLQLYPEDIKHRVCRVLIEHEWTKFRTDIYRLKGYTINYGPFI